ncbi:MAG: fructose 1,6-bisphosphatase [Candidatus Aenigmatarchaeota archaeon]|nr:MAG: fructose 1,6-bisphosphatase [Candidatus Aenigmarchaeota archaeon]
MAKVTLSVIKADIGGFPGHSSMHPALMELAKRELTKVKGKLIKDFRVLHCGDDLELIMTHSKGVDNKEIHKLAWDTFKKGTEEAKKLKLYGAGQDLLKDTFSGNVKGMGPGVAEMTFEERKSEPIMIFMADKTEPGAWNYALYKMFADPFSTAGLVIDPNMHGGFTFEVHDLFEHKKVMLKCPDEIYDMLALIGQPSRYVIKYVFRNSDKEIAASTSTQRLSLLAGRYVGKDDPVMIVRAQSGLPAVGEVLEPFSFPYTVAGWMRGSHHGPFMPVGFCDARPSRFDGPPRVICAGFQLSGGMLEGPADMFSDVSFDNARNMANDVADYLRRHGPFEPHRLSADEMEYTTLPDVLKKLGPRFKKL